MYLWSARRRVALFLCLFLLAVGLPAPAQSTLGAITGSVTDAGSAVLPHSTVTITNEQNGLVRTASTSNSGSYLIANLPIGTYTVTFSARGFDSAIYPHIAIQADRTVSLTATLRVGSDNTSVTVEASPLLNAVDTTNGYVLDRSQIDAVPLPTGSFTGLATLAPGVSAELNGGTGVNTGLGNQPIWANGQRDTSNTFLLNGVDASNLFNGKSSSQTASYRLTGNANPGNQGAGGVEQTAASVYLAIGQSLPTPPPDMLSEVRVNASMFDATQGATSGAHIDMSTASGTNSFHGSLSGHRGTSWINAAPFFLKQDPSVPQDQKLPQLHRWDAGGTAGLPLLHNRLFAFVGYKQLQVSDQETGISRLDVPAGLTDDRSASALATLANRNWTSKGTLAPGEISPVALFLMQYRFPNGNFLIPSQTAQLTDDASLTFNSSVPGTAYFMARQGVADLDWNASALDTVALRYYYQDDPSTSPYAYSNVAGFPQHTAAGSQVLALSNTWTPSPNLSTTQTLGLLRERMYTDNDQPFSPGQAGINTFGYPTFPGITIVDVIGNDNEGGQNPAQLFNRSLNIGMGAYSQSSFTGAFQNRLMPSASATWQHGRHTLTFGGNWNATQLNIRNNRTNKGIISVADFPTFLRGTPLAVNNNFSTTVFMQGDANRYYRANEMGAYLQDKFQATPHLSLTIGIRYDWNGALSEKYGRLYNFDPSRYAYDESTGEVTSNGFIFAGNYRYGTPGVSNTTLNGRQWGIAPRVGFAYSPERFSNRLVIRGGTGIYFDRGELFTYLSPGYAAGLISGGPFGVTQAQPFVQGTSRYTNSTLANPWCDPSAAAGAIGDCSKAPASPSGSPQTVVLPTRAEIASGTELPSFAVYDRNAVLPYTINFSFDLQWQPTRDTSLTVGYVGNLGRHLVMPIPFNQPGIATPSSPIHGEKYTYGYTATDTQGNPLILPGGAASATTYEGGNTGLRVPYIGYSAETVRYSTVGISSYNALQVHAEKRLSHGVQYGVSYTWSHTLDEQSAMGLFYNGNNALHPGESYASSDYDRTHVLSFHYLFQEPRFFHRESLAHAVLDGWQLQGATVLMSGQPFSVIDYSGAVGSIYFSVNDGITNPIVPLKAGRSPKSAKTGASGAFGRPALDADAFTVPDYRVDASLSPGGSKGVPPCGSSSSGAQVCDIFETDFTSGQRNIFRQSFQRRADISVVKSFQLHDRYQWRYSFDVYNLTNSSSFDVPGNDVQQNGYFNSSPTYDQSLSKDQNSANLYFQPSGLGYVKGTIGSPRQIQMSLRMEF